MKFVKGLMMAVLVLLCLMALFAIAASLGGVW